MTPPTPPTPEELRRLGEIAAYADQDWWTHEGDIFTGKNYVGRKHIISVGDAKTRPYVNGVDIDTAHAIVDAIRLLPGLLAHHATLMEVAEAGKRREFGTHTATVQGIEFSCKYIAPGVTMQDVVMAYENAKKQVKPEDRFAGNPSLWPNSRGLRAVVELLLTAIYGPALRRAGLGEKETG